MTTLAAISGLRADEGRRLAERMVGAVSWRRAGIAEVHAEPGFAIAVAAFAWQGPGRRLAVNDRWVVGADAAFYDAPGEAPADHLLELLVRGGEPALAGLRGDFAFVAYDRGNGRVLARRDHSGSRPLFTTPWRDGCALSTTIRGLLTLPGIDTTLNLEALAEDAANLDLAVPSETPFRSVERIPAGHQLRMERGERAVSSRWWDVPVFETGPFAPFDEAAAELRELLIQSATERLAGGSSVWLSGGYDSTAVFAGASEGRRRLGSGGSPIAISLEYPEGDEGRENEYIEATTSHWGASPRWVDVEGIPGIEDPQEAARERDEPFHHPYSLWNRALARASVQAGARVALSGNGGDQWFSVSPLYFADLVRRGEWWRIPREWRERVGRWQWGTFFRLGIQPNLPGWARTAIGRLRGRPVRHYLYRPPPRWIQPAFLARSALLERRDWRPSRRAGEGHSAWEHSTYLRASFGERVIAIQHGLCLREGLEMRSPLFDERIIRLAARRPREDANSAGQNKHLLRAAARPLLPPAVTAPRPRRTGQPGSYLLRSLRDNLMWAASHLSGDWRLSDLGIVDEKSVQRQISVTQGQETPDLESAVALLSAIHAELWLRSL